MRSPARIWAEPADDPEIDGSTEGYWMSREEERATPYVRADIADEMLAALKAVREDAIKNSGRIGPSALLTMQAAINKAEGESE